MTKERLNELVSAFSKAKIAVIGDFFLDKYLIIDPALNEPSLETGLDAYQIVDKRPSPGAAGTVCSNLAALGVGRVLAIGVIGDDGDGYELRQGLASRRIDHSHLLIRPELFTLTYTKPMVIDETAPGGEREINRMDVKWRKPTSRKIEDQVLAELDACLEHMNAVIIADQVQERNQGVITDRVRQGIGERALKHPDVVFFADSRMRIGECRNVIVKPNRAEAARAAGEEGGEGTVQAAERHARAIMTRTGRPVLVTMGEHGILVAEESGCTQVPAIRVTGKIDIVGAGDSATAGATCALCVGASCVEAALIGNLVASITIQQLGTTGTASPAQVRQRFDEAFPAG